MGNTVSGVPDDPFPISRDNTINSDLDLLSIVTARILNTSDIYDIENLRKPGVCGEYIVMLKKEIEKKLLTFVATTGKDKQAARIVYQNPRKMIGSEDERKEICNQLSNTVISLISIVVASLASIQITATRRVAAISGIVQEIKQKGGSVDQVRGWLLNNKYGVLRSDISGGGKTILFISPQNIPYKFDLILTTTNEHVTRGILGVETGTYSPRGGMFVHFISPIRIPGTSEEILPIKVTDKTGLSWMIGVLYKDKFRSLATTLEESPFYMFQYMYNRSISKDSRELETHDQLKAADAIFQTGIVNSNAIIQHLSDFFSKYTVGYAKPYAYPPQYPAQYPPAQYPGQYPQYPAYNPIPNPIPTFQPQPKYAPIAPKFPSAPIVPQFQFTQQYVIPQTAAELLSNKFKNFREILVTENCPASIRASSLWMGKNPDRTITTGVCHDKYWSEPNMSRIYPYATLQFLCIEDWESLGKTTKVANDWTDFITKLEEIYDGIGVPKLKKTSDSLENMRFQIDKDTIDVCKFGENPRVAYQSMKAGLDRLQAAYSAHLAKIWPILRSLVIVLQDPETKQYNVRLNPKVLEGPSQEYVAKKAEEARKIILNHYIEIEEIYVNTVRKLKPL